MNRLNNQTIKHLAELRDIAEANTMLATVMGDVAYLSGEVTEQQAQAWATAFRCMGERATTLAYELLEEDPEAADAELEGGHIAD